MREASPSRTALRVAMRRAAHQLIDSPRILDDPMALPIVGGEIGDTSGSSTLRAFVVARSRFAEDCLAAAVNGGLRQYVVLGAGFDTFAYRNPHPGVRVFEVDHPATQAQKRERLTAAGIAIPASMTFVGVDFERQKLDAELAATGFRRDQPAFFSWLGVVPYLTRTAFDETARFIASLPAGSGVVFDYALERAALTPPEQVAFDYMAARVAAAGEPFQLFFAKGELTDHLRATGFSTVDDLDSREINQRYFDGRQDGLRIAASLGRLIHAVV